MSNLEIPELMTAGLLDAVSRLSSLLPNLGNEYYDSGWDLGPESGSGVGGESGSDRRKIRNRKHIGAKLNSRRSLNSIFGTFFCV